MNFAYFGSLFHSGLQGWGLVISTVGIAVSMTEHTWLRPSDYSDFFFFLTDIWGSRNTEWIQNDFLGADRLKMWQGRSWIVEDVSKEANSSELFSLLLLLPEHSGASALANCCNIWDCQTLGCIKKHELYCCLHVAYGKQGMSTWTTMYFILSAVRQGSKNVGLVGEKLSKDKKLHGWELWKWRDHSGFILKGFE